ELHHPKKRWEEPYFKTASEHFSGVDLPGGGGFQSSFLFTWPEFLVNFIEDKDPPYYTFILITRQKLFFSFWVTGRVNMD
ncbi:MAG: hypothetical protein ACOC7U_07440, partial [Spirochaetota bacterium]